MFDEEETYRPHDPHGECAAEIARLTTELAAAVQRAERAESLLIPAIVAALDFNDRIPRGFGNWRNWTDVGKALIDALPNGQLKTATVNLIAAESDYRSADTIAAQENAHHFRDLFLAALTPSPGTGG